MLPGMITQPKMILAVILCCQKRVLPKKYLSKYVTGQLSVTLATASTPVASSRRLLNARKNHCSVSPVGRSKNMRGQVKSGEHNLHPMVIIGSTDLPKSGRGCVLSAHAGSDTLVLPPHQS